MPPWAREIEDRLLTGEPSTVDRFWADPARILSDAGMTPDPWQAELMRDSWTRALLLCSRQSGKSQVAGALALHDALTRPRSLVLLLSPTLRQSGELFRDKICPLWRALGSPLAGRPPTQLTLELSNGSRVISLPESEGGIRGYSGVRLLIVDEASRVSDDLYRAVRPMLAVSNGRLLALSTPFGKRGFFFEEWTSDHPWQRVQIKAEQCPRITKRFLREERNELGERWFRQEYGCSFEDMIGAVFSWEDIQAAMSDDVQPLFPVPPTDADAEDEGDVPPLFGDVEL
jgi:hypothetical protein